MDASISETRDSRIHLADVSSVQAMEEAILEVVAVPAGHEASEGDMNDPRCTMAWALDFARAVRERPRWARILFRIVVGRYAYREFIGLQDALIAEGYSPYFGYSLERQDYHKERVPLDCAAERPIVMKQAL